MALIPPQTFDGATSSEISDTLETILTCPSNYEINIHEIFFSNKTLDNPNLTVTMMIWMDDLQEYFYILKNQPVPIGYTYNMSGINMRPGDIIKCYASSPTGLDGSFFYMKRDVSPNISVIYPSRFNRKGLELTTTYQDIYITSVGYETNIHDLYICNVGEDNATTIDIEYLPTTGDNVKLVSNLIVPKNDMIFLDGINMKAGYKVRCRSNKNNMIHVIANTLDTRIS